MALAIDFGTRFPLVARNALIFHLDDIKGSLTIATVRTLTADPCSGPRY
jgi:hypothetical protein